MQGCNLDKSVSLDETHWLEKSDCEDLKIALFLKLCKQWDTTSKEKEKTRHNELKYEMEYLEKVIFLLDGVEDCLLIWKNDFD